MSTDRPAPVMPALPEDLLYTTGPIWEHICAWSEARPGKGAGKIADAIDAAITAAMHVYAREYAAGLQNRAELLAEDIECLHECLDDRDIPRYEGGRVLTPWGRVLRFRSQVIGDALAEALREGSEPKAETEGLGAEPAEPGPQGAPKKQEGAAPAEGVQPVARERKLRVMCDAIRPLIQGAVGTGYWGNGWPGYWPICDAALTALDSLAATPQAEAAGVPTQCIYPDCKCPVDAPPNWCALGLPARDSQAPAAPAAPVDALDGVGAIVCLRAAWNKSDGSFADLVGRFCNEWNAALSRPQAGQEPT